VYVGRLLGIALIGLGLAAGLAIFVGSFRGWFPVGLARTWGVAVGSCTLGVLVAGSCSARAEPERVARGFGLSLLALGLMSLGVLLLRAAGALDVQVPVQLWLLFAACTVFGGLATITSRL
jgi:hypothetical protein